MIARIRGAALTQVRKAYYRLLEKSLFRRSREQGQSRYFPICHGLNYLYQPLSFAQDGQAYFTKFYRESGLNPLAVDFGRFTNEVVAGEAVAPNQEWSMVLDQPSVLPIAVESGDSTRMDGKFTINLSVGGEKYPLHGLVGERFYYAPIPVAGPVSLSCSHRLIVGRPLPMVQAKPHRRRLVLNLFVDAFTPYVFKQVPFAELMPRLHAFFCKGAIFTNCHATSEWTLPSVPSIMSGRRTRAHGLYHPSRNPLIGDGYPLLADRFKADDYLGFITIPGGRMAPSYGYPRGFDRCLYRLYMPMSDSLTATYDHLRAFPGRDHFAWIGIMEAHHSLFYTPDISTMVGAGLDGMNFAARNEARNHDRKLDEGSRERYMGELRRIDFALGQLLDFVQQNYAEDEYLVTLFADHGVGFLNTSPHFLPEWMTNVPFMLRGGGVPQGQWDELVQTLDIAPTILHLCDLPPLEGIAGRLPEALGGPLARQHILAESHYPRRPYQAVLRDHQWEFQVRSESLLDEEGNYTLGKADLALYSLDRPDENVATAHPAVVERFLGLLAANG